MAGCGTSSDPASVSALERSSDSSGSKSRRSSKSTRRDSAARERDGDAEAKSGVGPARLSAASYHAELSTHTTVQAELLTAVKLPVGSGIAARTAEEMLAAPRSLAAAACPTPSSTAALHLPYSLTLTLVRRLEEHWTDAPGSSRPQRAAGPVVGLAAARP